MIVQLIDNHNRLVIPKKFREALGITDKVKLELVGKKLIISNPNGMITQTEIEQLYEKFKNIGYKTDYDKGFEEALKFILRK